MTIKQIKNQIKQLKKQLYRLTKECTHKDYKIQHVTTIDGMDTVSIKTCKQCGHID